MHKDISSIAIVNRKVVYQVTQIFVINANNQLSTFSIQYIRFYYTSHNFYNSFYILTHNH